jgi:hypothetical protein
MKKTEHRGISPQQQKFLDLCTKTYRQIKKIKPVKIPKKDWPVEYCIHCHTHRVYSEKYDAYYCPKCVFWLEKICPDRKCEFCANRPKYPDLKEEEKWNKKNKLQ